MAVDLQLSNITDFDQSQSTQSHPCMVHTLAGAARSTRIVYTDHPACVYMDVHDLRT